MVGVVSEGVGAVVPPIEGVIDEAVVDDARESAHPASLTTGWIPFVKKNELTPIIPIILLSREVLDEICRRAGLI
jgi:hypothetical protein